MNIQPIINIAEICSFNGIKHAIISPGSRSAPITLGFANHPKVNCKIVNDERSAAFIAMGMALQLNEPVVLICTSGTAALNYAPAIAEAYYQQIPLLVLTADRPPELIDQQDGQCLRQFEIYKNYIKESFQTPHTLSNENEENEFYTTIDNAINKVKDYPSGPVHINIPIREPFYPEGAIKYSKYNFANSIPFDEDCKLDFSEIITKINSSEKVLFIGGQQRHNKELEEYIEQLIELNYLVIADINSNLTSARNSIQTEEIIFQNELRSLHPEIVITFGNSILSKKLKLYFREHKIEHYHIAETDPSPDFFNQLTKIYQCKPLEFFKNILNEIENGNKEFFNLWIDKNESILDLKSEILDNSTFSEPHILFNLLKKLPKHSIIHLANSMAVRWLNIIGVNPIKKFTIQSNRGVSGIDGSNSTALGFSINSENDNYLITGDISFFYDRNAFWNNFIPDNFKIILLNNHEGGIFNMIPGPSNNQDTISFFTSSQNLTAELLTKEFDLDYFYVQNENQIEHNLTSFLDSNKCSIIEFKTNSKVNKEVLELLKNI